MQTERLLLRRWTNADLAPFAAINADPVVMGHFPKVLTREESDALVQHFEQHFDDHGFGLWALETKEDARFIGFVGPWRTTFQAHFTPCVEVAWRLAPSRAVPTGRPASRGLGEGRLNRR